MVLPKVRLTTSGPPYSHRTRSVLSRGSMIH